MGIDMLDEYWAFARKMISMKVQSPIKELMLQDDEAVGLVAKAVMKADITHVESKSNINTWRNVKAEGAIRKRIAQFARKEKFESLDSIYDLESPQSTPDDIVCEFERDAENKRKIKRLISVLNPTQKKCVEMHYLLGYTNKEISLELNITQEGVRKSIITGLKLMKELSNAN